MKHYLLLIFYWCSCKLKMDDVSSETCLVYYNINFKHIAWFLSYILLCTAEKP